MFLKLPPLHNLILLEKVHIIQYNFYVPLMYHFWITWFSWGSWSRSWICEIGKFSTLSNYIYFAAPSLGLLSNLNPFIQLAKFYSQEPYWGCITFSSLMKCNYRSIPFEGDIKYSDVLSLVSVQSIVGEH